MNIINIKKTIFGLAGLCAIFSLSLQSCQDKDSEDIFERSANERTATLANDLSKQLVGSENGWVLEYYPGQSKNFGGFVIGLRFNDKGEVLATSQPFFQYENGKLKPLTWNKSTYEVKTDRSVTLNFNTFNEAIHYFSDVDKNIGKGVGSAFEGDYQFLLGLSENPDVINLEGRESKRKMRLVRMTEPIQAYMDKLTEMKNKSYSYANMYAQHKDIVVGKIGGKDVEITIDPTYQILHISGKDLERVENLRYVYTPKGIRFDRPFLGVSELIWSDSESCYLAGSEKLIARNDPNYPEFAKYLGEYTLEVSLKGGVRKNFPKPIIFEQAGVNKYVIKGLGYNVYADFDVKNKRFEIKPQVVGGEAHLAVWDTKEGNLTWGEDEGMYSAPIEGQPNHFKMVDNGKWASYSATSFILWNLSGKGAYKGSLEPKRIVSPVFIKK